jgi:thiamine biosynthesis lipoprotein ApbE
MADLPPELRAAGTRTGGVVRTAVEHIMGTAVSIAVWTEDTGPRPPQADQAVEEAFATLRRADTLFSPFRPDSQVSRLRDGRLTLADAYATAVAVGARALPWLSELDGYEALLVDADGGIRWTPASRTPTLGWRGRCAPIRGGA